MTHRFQTANTILYCSKWRETAAFYREGLGLPVSFANDWFVEFILSENARLSIADQQRASVKSAAGQGMTISLATRYLETERTALVQGGWSPSPIKRHPWGADVFYVHDPEGHRLEFWRRDSQP